MRYRYSMKAALPAAALSITITLSIMWLLTHHEAKKKPGAQQQDTIPQDILIFRGQQYRISPKFTTEQQAQLVGFIISAEMHAPTLVVYEDGSPPAIFARTGNPMSPTANLCFRVHDIPVYIQPSPSPVREPPPTYLASK